MFVSENSKLGESVEILKKFSRNPNSFKLYRIPEKLKFKLQSHDDDES